MTRHLVLFVRAPVLGAVKSRLARDIGPVAAWKFHRDTMRSLFATLGDERTWKTWLAVTPSRFLDGRIWPPHLPRIDQGQGDLGLRMARPFIVLPPGPIVMAGTDIPELERKHIMRAFDSLKRAEVVLGPADDGGFWLMGMSRRPRPPRHVLARMFAGVRWSTTNALADVLSNLNGFVEAALVNELADIDTGSDFVRWRARSR
tara:strand:- start:1478 stop:2086 length:609 start_codon:yes stop_codon:yes gene_type:complete